MTDPLSLSEKDAEAYRAQMEQLELAARNYGLPLHTGNLCEAEQLMAEYSLEWVLEAIRRAGSGKEQTWRYVRGILSSWKSEGGIDHGRPAARPGANPAARETRQQQYNQRAYDDEPSEMPEWLKARLYGSTAAEDTESAGAGQGAAEEFTDEHRADVLQRV